MIQHFRTATIPVPLSSLHRIVRNKIFARAEIESFISVVADS